MPIRPDLDHKGRATLLVDTYIGDAYPVVKAVYDNLQELAYLADLISNGQTKDIQFRVNYDLEQIEWSYTTTENWQKLFAFTDILGDTVNNIIANQTVLTNQLNNLMEQVYAYDEDAKNAQVAAELARDMAITAKNATVLAQSQTAADREQVTEYLTQVSTYLVQANQAAANADISATLAKNSEIAAKSSETNSKASEDIITAAKNSIDESMEIVNAGLLNVEASKTAAQTAATSAQASSTSATSAKTAAESARTAAQFARDTAQTAASTATADRDSAAASASSANTAAIAANQYKQDAAASANAANASAIEAADSATSVAIAVNTTETKAAEAAASALSAAGSADSATASAVGLTAAVTAAAASATAADVSKAAAEDSAIVANAANIEAKTARDEAVIQATAAANSVIQAQASASNANNYAVAAATEAAAALESKTEASSAKDSAVLDAVRAETAAANAENIANTVGVQNASVNGEGNLIITRNNGSTINAGSVIGPKGEDGTSLKILDELASEADLPTTGNNIGDAYLIASNIYIWSANEVWLNAGSVKGPKGDTGDIGPAGPSVWGVINGDISSQEDLKLALDGKVSKVVGKELSTNDFSNAEKAKLAAIEEQATKNATDSQLRDRSTHTGVQGMETVNGLQAALNAKVSVEGGKGLSTNDYTTAEKTKLSEIATGATANDTNANLLNRVNHTGAQAISTITGLQTKLDNLTPALTLVTISSAVANVAAGQHAIIANGSACTLTLPNSAVNGVSRLRITVANGLKTNVINWNGLKHEGSSETSTMIDDIYASTEWQYINAAYGWKWIK